MRFIGFLVALLTITGASAAVIAPRDYYEGVVPAERQNPAERDSLLSQAMGQVLVRITGNRQVLTQQAAQDLQKDAARYVQQFGYEHRTLPAAPSTSATVSAEPSVAPAPSPAESAAPKTIQVFSARFDASALNAQLRANGLPVWPHERPPTLFWLAIQGNAGHWLINTDTAADQAPALIQTALERGLPVMLPSPPGVNTPDVLDIMQGVTEQLLKISRSYGVSRVVLARITQDGLLWNGSWTLVEEGQPQQTWQLSGSSLYEAMANGVNQIADQYAGRYGVTNTVQSEVVVRGAARLDVTGIRNLNDYARVAKYLSSLTPVSAASVIDVSGSSASYQLSIHGDRNALRQAISAGNVLEADAGSTSDAASDNGTLKYHIKAETP